MPVMLALLLKEAKEVNRGERGIERGAQDGENG